MVKGQGHDGVKITCSTINLSGEGILVDSSPSRTI